MRRVWLPLAVMLAAASAAQTASLDAARVVVYGDFNILFQSGPHQNGDYRAFCAAFG